jgi:hypothetical protein
MFTLPRPQILSPPTPESEILTTTLAGEKRGLTTIERLSVENLKPTGQKQGGGVPFFEQGLITGSVVLISSLGVVAAAAGVLGVKRFLR